MRTSRFLWIAASALAVAAPAAGQTPSRAEMQSEPPPILALYGERERLALTSEQLVALDSIQSRWSVENERLTNVGMIVSSGLVTTVEVRRVEPRSPEARANHFRAARAVGEVLTEEQRRAVCALHRRKARAWWPWCG